MRVSILCVLSIAVLSAPSSFAQSVPARDDSTQDASARKGAAASTQTRSTRDSGDAAHLFVYRVHPGEQKNFDEGYRTHLGWHRDQRDPVVWYGWYVAKGDQHVGLFVDGSFGAPFSEVDQRVKPGEDLADADRTFGRFADTAYRSSFRVRREFSSGLPLEQWRPSRLVQVFHYTLKPGGQARFERALRTLRDALSRDRNAPVHTWYERVTGGAVPGYMLMVARENWASYDGTGGDSVEARLMREDTGPGGSGRAALDDLAASVATVEAETWNYRKDLSYFPDR